MQKIKLNIQQVTFTAVLLVAFGCGGNKDATADAVIAEGDLKAVQQIKKELTAKQKEISNEIAKLDSFIVASRNEDNFPLITVQELQSQDFVHFIELQGDVTTKQNVLIYPEMSGTLIKVYVTEGQSVKEGQLLASIDDGGMDSQLAQLKTQLALAKTTFERQQKLWDQEIGSEIQYLQAKTSYEAQEAAVEQMETQLAKFSIRAPFAGVIDDVIKDQGTVVGPGGPGSEVFRIINLSNMFIEVPVPETYITSITKGKKVRVVFPILNESLDSYVRETGNFINPNNRSFTVEIPVQNKTGNVKPNLTAKVHINDYSNDAALLIPQNTISENAEGEQYAYIVNDVSENDVATAKKAIITTGKTQGDFVEVLSGIEPGQSIIVEGARSVKEGQKVKILKS
ncbi:MAG: efflux RND transporter periplasmic adaptor subunit [Bacteroidota bacterium]